MGRIASAIVAAIGLCGISTWGFSTPRSINSSASSVRQRISLFPTHTTRTTTTCNNRYTASKFMTKDDSLSEGEKTAEERVVASSSETTPNGTNGDASAVSMKDEDTSKTATTNNGSNGFSLILLPTLLFKFTIVLLVKFATDIVVFPLLWLYRLARLGKRKLLRGISKLLGKGDELDVKVNGNVNGGSTAVSAE